MKQQPKPLCKTFKGTFYTITNCMNGLALSMPKTNKFLKDKPQFQQWNPNNINQLWMIQEISPNRYELVHAISTLVIQCIVGSNICKLEFGKQKSSQLFYLQEGTDIQKYMEQNENRKKNEGINYQPPLPHVVNQAVQQQKMVAAKSSIIRQSIKSLIQKPSQRFVAKIRIRERQKSRKYLFCDAIDKSSNINFIQEKNNKCSRQRQYQGKKFMLKFMQIDVSTQSESSLWQLKQVYPQENQYLAQTCMIASMRSGQVLDVPEASDKQGVQIIQYPCNFKFNQKWILKKVDEVNGYGFYFIMNAKTGLYLDIKGESTKQGSPIIQWENHQSKNQVWRLQEQGKRVYLIRSALDKELLLGVKQNSLKQSAEVVTSKIETDCFWVIHGYIP